MKAIKFLGLMGLFTMIVMSSCKKDAGDLGGNSSNAALEKQLRQSLSEFELIELDPNKVINELQGASSEKNLVLVPGKYEFKVENTSPEESVEIYNQSTKSSEFVDLKNTSFDNYATAAENQYASFSLLDNALEGEFALNGENYVLAPARNFVSTAASNSYVIYKDNSLLNQGLDLDFDDYSSDYTISNLGISQYAAETGSDNSSLKNKPRVKNLRVNLFTDSAYRTHMVTIRKNARAHVLRTFLVARAKFRQAKMPVNLLLGRIYNASGSQISHPDSIWKLNRIEFTNFLQANPTLNGAANLLFTADITGNANAWPATVCRTDSACATIKYSSSIHQLDNYTAQQIALMLGCLHLDPVTYGANVMNPIPPVRVARFKPISRVQMATYIGMYNSCLF